MKKSVLSMLAVAALVFGMTSCNGAKKTSEEAEKTEEAAVIAGKAETRDNSIVEGYAGF